MNHDVLVILAVLGLLLVTIGLIGWSVSLLMTLYFKLRARELMNKANFERNLESDAHHHELEVIETKFENDKKLFEMTQPRLPGGLGTD